MIAIEVHLNGQKIFTAGIEEWAGLHCHVDAMRRDTEQEFAYSVGALLKSETQGEHMHARWGRHQLNINDEITFKIIETDEIDPPIKIYRSDAQVQEEPFTEKELEEFDRQEYERLKQKYETVDR